MQLSVHLNGHTNLSISTDVLRSLFSSRTHHFKFFWDRVDSHYLHHFCRLVAMIKESHTLLQAKGAFVWEYSGIYSGYSAPGSRIAGMEIQVFRNRKSSQTNANLHYSSYSYSGLIPNKRALRVVETRMKMIWALYWPAFHLQ